MLDRSSVARVWRHPGRTGLALLVLAALTLAGCAGRSDSPLKQDPKAAIVVWVDATREPFAKDYAKKHPELDLKIVTVPQDPGYVSTKVQLANKTGAGWPDVVFLADPGEIATLSAAPFDWASPLNNLVPSATVAKFAPSATASCNIGGNVYCLKNDLAQTVLWFDKGLMAQFGYRVPGTWDEFKSLGERVATEHPGYIIGTVGFHTDLNTYWQSSGCPITEVVSPTEVKIDGEAPACTRVVDLLQPLLDAGSVLPVSPFDQSVVKLGEARKILMFTGASWMGDFVFKTTYKTPPGQLAAAPMPTWAGEDKPYAGEVGGGVWAVSRHAKNLQGAADFIAGMTTDPEINAKVPTYPAYGPAADAWLDGKSKDQFYANDVAPVFRQEAQLIRPNWNFTRYSPTVSNSFDTVVAGGLAKGGRLGDLMEKYLEQVALAAKDSGYTVSK